MIFNSCSAVIDSVVFRIDRNMYQDSALIYGLQYLYYPFIVWKFLMSKMDYQIWRISE